MEACTGLCPLRVLSISQTAETCTCGYCAFYSTVRALAGLGRTYAPVFTSTPPAIAQQWALFEQGKQELLLNLSRVDECCAHFSQALETHILQAQAYRDLVISQFQQWKVQLSRDISESVAEVQAKLEGQGRDLQGKYSVPLWLYRPGNLTLFTFEQSSMTPTDYSLMPKAAYRTPRPADLKVDTHQTKAKRPKPEELPTVPLLSHSHIAFFDFDTMNSGPAVKLDRSVSVGYQSLWAVVGPSQVFLCNVSNRRSYLVSGDGQVVSTPDTLFTHTDGGIVMWKAAIHLFGGSAKSQGTSSERLSLSLSHWCKLPNMYESRFQFTPVVWRNSVYLCGGGDSRTVEVFDSYSFRLMYFLLPEPGKCVSAVYGEQLFMYASHKGVVIISDSGQVCPLVTLGKGAVQVKRWNCAPVAFGKQLIWATLGKFETCPVSKKK